MGKDIKRLDLIAYRFKSLYSSAQQMGHKEDEVVISTHEGKYDLTHMPTI